MPAFSRFTASVSAAIFATALLGATDGHASLVLTANTVFNGSTPTSTPPWLTATFSFSSPGTVTLELKASLNVASEFIDEVTFNLDPALVPSNLTIQADPGNSGFSLGAITKTTANAQNLTGGGSAGFGFDVKIAFGTSAGSRFDGTDVAKFIITDITDSITDASFEYINTGTAAARIGAHIQGIPVAGGGTTSGAVKDGATEMSEPSTLALFGIGLAGLGLARRRRA